VSKGPFRQAIADLVPYEPGKPVEEVQRELGIERVVKLASNEGPFGPFPAALEAIERSARDLNRYPDGGVWALRSALAERHDVPLEAIVVGAGADGVIDLLSQATLDPGDEIVCGWPSFPSYILYAAKLGAVSVKVPLREHTYDSTRCSMRSARARSSCTCATRTIRRARRTDATSSRHSSTVCQSTCSSSSTRRTSSTSTTPTTRTASRRISSSASASSSCARSRRSTGLRACGSVTGVAPPDVVVATSKVRRAFDVATTAQAAALASIADDEEIARRRAQNAAGRAALEATLREHGLEPVGPALGNFVYAEVGDGRALFEQLLRQGVIVRLSRASARRARSASLSARRRRTRSSPTRSDMSFRECRHNRMTLLT